MKLPFSAIALTIMFSTILVNAPLQSIITEDNPTKSRQSVVDSWVILSGDRPHQDRKLSPLLHKQKSESKLDESPLNASSFSIQAHSQPPRFMLLMLLCQFVSGPRILLPVLITIGVVAGCTVWKILMGMYRLALRKSLDFPRE